MRRKKSIVVCLLDRPSRDEKEEIDSGGSLRPAEP